MKQNLKVKGHFELQHFRAGKLIGKHEIENAIVTVGANSILEAMFRGGSQSSSWYIGLVNNSGFSAFNAADTMSSHAGWTEATSYSGGVRPQWSPDAAASRSITNSSTVDFNITGTMTVKGMFIADDDTLGGSSGLLWSEGAFSSLASVQNGDVLKTTYTLTIS